MNTYSVSLRLQRVTTEEAYISVPVTPDLIVEQSDGSGRLNVPAMVARAVEMGQSPEVVWGQEEQRVEPHPIQKSPYPDNGDA